MKESFFKLSAILTGFNDLPRQAGNFYYDELLKNLKNDFSNLLSEFDVKVKDKTGQPEELVRLKLWSNPVNKKICQTIIRAWYNASLSKAVDGFDMAIHAEFYYEALIWKTIEAHPTGLSGGYFGYWRYAPEN